MTVDASVIIPTLDVAETLPAQLDALSAQDYDGQVEIIVADNGSNDSTPTVVRDRTATLPGLRLVDASDVSGACHARNVGARSAQGSKLLFCDGDDVVTTGWCSGLVAGLADYDAVGGPVDFFELNPDLPGRDGDNPLMRGLDEWPDYLPFAWAGNFGVRSDVFEAIGGFDESYTGCDDLEISWRLQRQGHTLGFAPDAVLQVRLRSDTRTRVRLAFHYATDEPRLYRAERDHGMPRGTPLWSWLGSLAKRVARWIRHPTNPGARQIALDSSARFLGLLVGSAKHRTWFLGPR